jgi:hypothetical protein
MNDDINLMRWISSMTGQVYENQVITLKRVALLVGGSPIVLTVNPASRQVSYVFEGSSVEGAEEKIRYATAAIIGPIWRVAVRFEGNK